jgi:hypothetical protein
MAAGYAVAVGFSRQCRGAKARVFEFSKNVAGAGQLASGRNYRGVACKNNSANE